MQLETAERDEQQRVDEVARGVEFELVTLRGPPGEPLGQLVMVDDVEQAERELNDDQDPQEGRIHGWSSRKIAIWRSSRPWRGWMICSVKLNLPSGSSACVT